jgi:hypothetical protein
MDFDYYKAGTYEPGYFAVRSLAPIKPSLSPDYIKKYLAQVAQANTTSPMLLPDAAWSNPVQECFRRSIRVPITANPLPMQAKPSRELPPIRELQLPEVRWMN